MGRGGAEQSWKWGRGGLGAGCCLYEGGTLWRVGLGRGLRGVGGKRSGGGGFVVGGDGGGAAGAGGGVDQEGEEEAAPGTADRSTGHWD